jgi:hypothetical protein
MEGWKTSPSLSIRHSAEIVSGELDRVNERGSRTRLPRFAPGAFTTKPFVHRYWEEISLVPGDLDPP